MSKRTSIILCALLIACGGSSNDQIASQYTASDFSTTAASVSIANFSAFATSVPSDGATVSGTVKIAVQGTGIKNAELVPANSYVPIYARATVSPNGEVAWLDFDSTKVGDGPIRVRVLAWDQPHGAAQVNEIVAMSPRTWNIKNGNPPTSPSGPPQPPTSEFSVNRVFAPFAGSPIRGTVTLEVHGNNLQNVELLPSSRLVPILDRFSVDKTRKLARFELDTREFKDGPFDVRIVAWNQPAGSAQARNIVAMPARRWIVSNNTPAAPHGEHCAVETALILEQRRDIWPPERFTNHHKYETPFFFGWHWNLRRYSIIASWKQGVPECYVVEEQKAPQQGHQPVLPVRGTWTFLYRDPS